MRIACPNCHALYDVPDNLLGGRPRRLRCEQCGHGWHVMPGGQEGAAMPAPPSPADLPEDLFAEDAASEDAPGQGVNAALGRRFGQPEDAAAMAEIRAALQDEALAHPPHESSESDRFADLVRAARNNEVELESLSAGKPVGRAADWRLVALLGLLLILAVIVVERHAVIRVIPASAKLFHALHLA